MRFNSAFKGLKDKHYNENGNVNVTDIFLPEDSSMWNLTPLLLGQYFLIFLRIIWPSSLGPQTWNFISMILRNSNFTHSYLLPVPVESCTCYLVLYIRFVTWYCTSGLLLGTVHQVCYLVLYIRFATGYCTSGLLLGSVHQICYLVLYIRFVTWCCTSGLLLGAVHQVCYLVLYIRFLYRKLTQNCHITLYITSGLSHWTRFLNHYHSPAEMLHRAFEDCHIGSTGDKLKQPTLL